MDKGLVFNHCQKSLQNHAPNDIGHQRKQIITASDWVTICAGHNPLVLRDSWLQVNAVKLQLCNHKELWVRNAKLFKQPISSNCVHAACIFNIRHNKFVLVTDTGCNENVVENLLVYYTKLFEEKKSTWGDQSRQVTTRCFDQRSSMNCLLRDSFAPAWISLGRREEKSKNTNQ